MAGALYGGESKGQRTSTTTQLPVDSYLFPTSVAISHVYPLIRAAKLRYQNPANQIELTLVTNRNILYHHYKI